MTKPWTDLSEAESKSWGASLKMAQEYRNTGNPIFALASYVHARDAQVDVDENVLQLLDVAIRRWFEKNGSMTLDEIMGITIGTGATSALAPLWTVKRNRMMFNQMAILIELKWQPRDAANAVCRYLRRVVAAYPQIKHQLVPSNAGRKRDEEIISPDTLRRYWREKKRERSAAIVAARNTLLLWDNCENGDVLRDKFVKDMSLT